MDEKNQEAQGTQEAQKAQEAWEARETLEARESLATIEHIFQSLSKIINSLKDEWEYSGEITPDTSLFTDLDFESIDAVVLGSMIEEHYNRPFPFAEYLASIGESAGGNKDGVRDIKVRDLVGFIYRNLSSMVADSAGGNSGEGRG
jgi:acyl carrier protein